MAAQRDSRGRFIKGSGGGARKSRSGKKHYGVTIDDSRFESFINSSEKLGRLSLRVGILSAKPKYPAGWVGRKSRGSDGDRLDRLKAGWRSSSDVARYRKSKRARKKKFSGFRRKARRKQVQVAKVAAVVGFGAQQGERPKLPGMWLKSNERLEQFLHQQVIEAGRTVLSGKSARSIIERIGSRFAMAYKADVIRSGHVDSRLLLNTINWEIVDRAHEQLMQRMAAARRKAAKLAKGA